MLLTHAAWQWAHGRAMVERTAGLGATVIELPADRLVGLGQDGDPREAYSLLEVALSAAKVLYST